MRLLIDGNVLLDVLQRRQPFYRDSATVWKLCETEQAEGFVSTLTFADLVNVMGKEHSPDRIEDVLQKLSLIFRFTELGAADLAHAAGMKWEDFEDAVQAAAAERLRADFIITRKIRDLKKSRIVAFTPAEFLARL